MQRLGTQRLRSLEIRTEEDKLFIYEKIKDFRQSGQSQVHLVKSKKDGKEYALKYTKEYDMRNEKNANHIMNEALLLNQLSHPNIIKVVDFYNVRKYGGFCSVMEYSKCYTLKEIVEECERI